MSVATELLSGPVLRQNQIAADDDYIVPIGAWWYQEFFLPPNFERGSDDGEMVLPDLSGISVMMGVNNATMATLEWTLEEEVDGDFVVRASGTTVGAEAVNTKVWVDAYFDDRLVVSETMREARLRIGIHPVSSIDRLWFSWPNPLQQDFQTRAEDSEGTPIRRSGSDEDTSFLFRILAVVGDDGVDFLGNTYRGALYTHSADNVLANSG